MVTKEQIAESVSCGPDPEPVVDAIGEMVAAGIDHVYLHQIGPDQEGLLPVLDRRGGARRGGHVAWRVSRRRRWTPTT